MAPPKRRTSLSKIRSRIKSHRRPMPKVQTCKACGAPAQPHRVCPSCGTYRGRQVLSISSDDE